MCVVFYGTDCSYTIKKHWDMLLMCFSISDDQTESLTKTKFALQRTSGAFNLRFSFRKQSHCQYSNGEGDNNNTQVTLENRTQVWSWAVIPVTHNHVWSHGLMALEYISSITEGPRGQLNTWSGIFIPLSNLSVPSAQRFFLLFINHWVEAIAHKHTGMGF